VAHYFAVNGFGPSLGFDNAIKRIAIRAVEMQRRAFEHHTLIPQYERPFSCARKQATPSIATRLRMVMEMR
jgi:hypothetical protein